MEKYFIAGIMEHIEEAGIHSGDSACSLPPYSLVKKHKIKLLIGLLKLPTKLNVVGLMNTQLAIKNNKIYVLR